MPDGRLVPIPTKVHRDGAICSTPPLLWNDRLPAMTNWNAPLQKAECRLFDPLRPFGLPNCCSVAYFNAAGSTGILRKRLPVAAKIALATAGTMAEVPHSPIPPGGSVLLTMWTSTVGASSMRNIW